MADSTAVAAETGVFTRDQAEILSARKDEPHWLRDRRLRAQEQFAEVPMPSTRSEEWRYTDISAVLKLDELRFAEDAAPAGGASELPAELRAAIEESAGTARLVQQDASVVLQEVPDELRSQGVVFSSLEQALRDHPELVERHLGSVVTGEEGKFSALNTGFWSGGLFLYVPRGVQIEEPLRAIRWISEAGSSVFPRTLIVAEPEARVTLVERMLSPDFASQTFSAGAAEVIAGEYARVNYVALQQWGEGVVHLTTDRLVAGRDARITSLYLALGGQLGRGDIQCQLRKPGSNVDMLGLYIAEGDQHFDHETLQDHISPHASSNLLFKGALFDRGRSVFRGVIRVHPKAQRTDAYQTNRNLILSDQARADSLPNLEIQADDVRCSHAATVGQLDEEEIFYLLSRGIPKDEAVRLVIFGFFGEVLDQLPDDAVRKQLVAIIEKKLDARRR